MINISSFGLANGGHDRRVLGADVIDDIGEVFTETDYGMC
jgi:hypothetical protein